MRKSLAFQVFLAPNYVWKDGDQEYRADVIQTQTPMNSGNSGGPLFDKDGRLVGINTFVWTEFEGIHWAVAVSEIQKFIAGPIVLDPTLQ